MQSKYTSEESLHYAELGFSNSRRGSNMSQFVRDYYNTHAENEWNRLNKPLCRIEFVSTMRLIDQYFPKHGRICDIGGGPGRYTIELLRRGYLVTLFDLSEEEIRLASTLLETNELSAEQLIVGDARDMSILANESFDAVLLMGPMYHIIESNERAKVLHELKRILKPQGVAIIAYLNAWGILRTGITDLSNRYKDISFLRSMLKEQTFVGQSLSGFTECYWSTPEAALHEIKEAGLEIVNYIGAEGFAGGMGILLEQLATEIPEAYENVVQIAAETSELAQYRDGTDHLHFVVRKKALEHIGGTY
jgi:ubiquinone/menaquinone biosynthesis C-methylase UbiE